MREVVLQLVRDRLDLFNVGVTGLSAYYPVHYFVKSARGEVMAGSTVARAMVAFPRVFPELYRTLVAAGEASGNLAVVLGRLADYLDERHALRSRLALALLYPAIVLAVS